jgi:hypothetical protein
VNRNLGENLLKIGELKSRGQTKAYEVNSFSGLLTIGESKLSGKLLTMAESKSRGKPLPIGVSKSRGNLLPIG